MKARIKWLEGRAFVGESGSGHAIVMGASGGADGRSVGASPMELVMMGMGGCMSFDVIHILEKSREPVADCVAELEAIRADNDPKVFTQVHVEFVVTGDGLNRAKVERAVSLSAEKYCSASAMIAKTAEVTYHVEVIDGARAADALGARSPAM